MNQIIASDKPTTQDPRVYWSMYRSLVGLGCVCGFILALVFWTTRPAIEHKRAQHLNAAVMGLFPGSAFKLNFNFDGVSEFALSDTIRNSEQVYATYDAKGALLGLAVVGEAMGYQDTIRMIYAYDPGAEILVGTQVLQSKETPGLGDKIASEPHFVANFKQLDVQLNETGDALLHSIIAVKQGHKHHPWEIDAITGATISSKAVANLIQTSAQFWLPVLAKNIAVFERAGIAAVGESSGE